MIPKTSFKQKTKGADITADPLRVRFTRLCNLLITEQEALGFDVSNMMWMSFEERIKAGEAINVQIRGEVTTGKSTVASVIMEFVNTVLKKDKGIMDHLNTRIFSDQIEFIRWIKKKEEHICIQIDEWNSMVTTGYNATTEMTLFDHYSDVFAQRYVHRVSCAPSKMIDMNCYLLLDIEGRDKNKGVTRCKATYRDVVSQRTCVIGFVDIYVGDVRKKEWYAKYRLKKFKRMELLEKHGYRDIRELEYARVALKTWRKMCISGQYIKHDRDTIMAFAQAVVEEEGKVYSIVTMARIASDAKSLLGLQYRIEQLERRIEMLQAKEKDTRILEMSHKELGKLLNELVEKWEKKAKIYEEWVDVE